MRQARMYVCLQNFSRSENEMKKCMYSTVVRQLCMKNKTLHSELINMCVGLTYSIPL